MPEPQTRLYRRDEVVSFRRTGDAFGGLSNMAPGYPVRVNGLPIRTAEALYQACRFPHLPDVQHMIVSERSPMTAKMRSKPFRHASRPDWDEVRIPIMKWCLRVKLACNWHRFSSLLLETGDRPIVEDSSRDDFWGARPEDDVLEGRNVLGRLLMELRGRLAVDPLALKQATPLPIARFTLFDRPIEVVAAGREPSVEDEVCDLASSFPTPTL